MTAALIISAFICLVIISRAILWFRITGHKLDHGVFEHDSVQLEADLSVSGIVPGGSSWYPEYEYKGQHRHREDD